MYSGLLIRSTSACPCRLLQPCRHALHSALSELASHVLSLQFVAQVLICCTILLHLFTHSTEHVLSSHPLPQLMVQFRKSSGPDVSNFSRRRIVCAFDNCLHQCLVHESCFEKHSGAVPSSAPCRAVCRAVLGAVLCVCWAPCCACAGRRAVPCVCRALCRACAVCVPCRAPCVCRAPCCAGRREYHVRLCCLLTTQCD